jgi:hypothetical protein
MLPEPSHMMFARWNVPPGAGESANGYLLRLVRAQGIPSMLTFNIWNDVPDNLVRHEKSMLTIDSHPFPEDWKARVRNATPTTVGECVEIAGERFKPIQVSRIKRRWCPACLAEAPYHRVWWEIVCVKKCPYHCIPLETRDLGGGVVSWTWTDFETSRNGYLLTRFGVPRSNEVTFSRYMIGRLGFDSAIPHPVFDKYELRHVIRFCETYGRFLQNGYNTRDPGAHIDDIDVGFRATETREVLTDHVRHWIRKHARVSMSTGGGAVVGQDNTIGWLRTTHFLLWDRELDAMSRAVCKEATSLEFRGVARPTRVDDFETTHTTVRMLAEEMGMTARGVSVIANELGVIDRARSKSALSESAVARIREFKKTLSGPEETRHQLGIPRHALRTLMHAGYLKLFPGVIRGRESAHVDQSRIDAILRRIDELKISGNPELITPFTKYCRQSGLTIGEGAVSILRGEVKILAKGVRSHGFAGLRVEGTMLAKKRSEWAKPVERRRAAHPDYVNVREACAILDLSNISVLALAERGSLGEVKRTRSELLISRKAVVAFGKRHTRISTFDEVMGVHATALYKRMVNAGVRPVLSGTQGNHKVEAVYRRRDILKVLGLERDTSTVADKDLQKLWKRMTRHIWDLFITIYMPAELPVRGQRVWGPSACLSILFKFDSEARELDAMVVQRGGKRKAFRLPVNIPDKELIRFLKEVKAMAAESKAQKFAQYRK